MIVIQSRLIYFLLTKSRVIGPALLYVLSAVDAAVPDRSKLHAPIPLIDDDVHFYFISFLFLFISCPSWDWPGVNVPTSHTHKQEMMNETSRGSNNIGRRNFMEQSNNGRGQQGGGGMIQRSQYLNPSMPGPIPSIGTYIFSPFFLFLLPGIGCG